ncbi:MAG: hypothetical protein OEO23_06580 [Gemmatimonadota bacterium]|nr:hypothetical protein [Gemmatimonadota bacterium]
MTLRWETTGETGETQVRFRPRGNFRKQRSTCRDMPPLRLNFATDEVEGTVFEGQNRLKLVTHCRDGDQYEQNVFEEYLAYRLYNAVTDESFRVRLVMVTYLDPEEGESATHPGFLIEDEERMAERLGGTIEVLEQIHPLRYARGRETRVSVFQYMIGNTDFSQVESHNVVIVRTGEGELLPIPYDFDWSGLVSARYARPNETLGIRNVRQRLYRGVCHQGLAAESALAPFRALPARTAELYAEMEGWEEDSRKQADEYLREFFELLEDPGKAEREIVDRCRRVG